MIRALSFCDIAAPCNACGAWVYVGTSWHGDTLDLNPDNTLHDCGLPAPDLVSEVPDRPARRRGRLKLSNKRTPRAGITDRIRKDVCRFVADRPGCTGEHLTSLSGDSNTIRRIAKELAAEGVLRRVKVNARGYRYFSVDEAA